MENEGDLVFDPADGDSFTFSLAGASSAAQNTMQEDFFSDPTEAFSPFGNDDGFDASYGFRTWRSGHTNLPALPFLNDLFHRRNYPWFDLTCLEMEKIDAYTKLPGKTDLAFDENITAALKAEMDEWGTKQSDNPDLQEEGELSAATLSSQGLGLHILIGIDNAILGTAFAQFVLEGADRPRP